MHNVELSGSGANPLERQVMRLLTTEIFMEWQPIETAPKDGTKILAREGEGKTQYWTWFYMGDWCHVDTYENDDQEEYLLETWWNPTEWKPYPSKIDRA